MHFYDSAALRPRTRMHRQKSALPDKMLSAAWHWKSRIGAPKNTVMHRVKRLDQDYVDNLYEYDDFFIHAEAAWYAGRLPFQSGFRFQFERAVVVYADNAMKVYDTEGNVINMTETAGQADGELQLPQSDGYFNEIQYFVQCVEQDKETDIVRPDELRTAIRLLNRM